MFCWKNFGMAGLLLAGVGLAGAEQTGEAAAPAPTVLVTKARMVRESQPKRYVGSIEPIEQVDVMPRVTGTLWKVHFTEGSPVKAGALLYEIEDTTYRAAVETFRAQQEQLEAALRYADVEYQRNSSLLKSRAVSATSHDKALMEIDSAKAKIKGIKASLLDAENNLSYTKIYAPISGVIGISKLTVGNLITPAGGKLTDIKMIAPIYVRFSLSERVFRRDFGGAESIRDRAVIRLQLADGTVYPEAAKITLIDNKVSATTNTITFWATFQNKDHQLLPGSFVTVLLSARSEKPLPSIPPSAMIAGNDGYQVYVLEAGNRVAARKVVPGGMTGEWQLIESGLDGSERIVADGMHKVKPGMTATAVAATPRK